MAVAELLIDAITGDVIAAKRPGSPWGRRELRPAQGKARAFLIIESDEPDLADKVARGVAVHPFAEGEEKSTKRVDVAKLSTNLKNRLADPNRSGKIGPVALVSKGGK